MTLIPADDLEQAMDVLYDRGFRAYRPPSAVSQISLNPFLSLEDFAALLAAQVRVIRYRLDPGGSSVQGVEVVHPVV